MSSTAASPALRIRGLSKTYKNGVEALKGIDLDVPEGEFFGLLGPNGAGKSTTIGVVTSLINRSAGAIEVFGVDTERDLEGAKRLIGVVPQELNINQFEQPLQIVAQQAGYYGVPWREAQERAAECLNWMGLWEKRSVMARSLSGGMKRRLMIARALVQRPDILILDDALSAVDTRTERQILNAINRRHGS